MHDTKRAVRKSIIAREQKCLEYLYSYTAEKNLLTALLDGIPDHQVKSEHCSL
jgi:hypothetical protein